MHGFDYELNWAGKGMIKGLAFYGKLVTPLANYPLNILPEFLHMG